MQLRGGLKTITTVATTLWSTYNNKLYYKDKEYHVKGINMQGFEFNTMSPSCLHIHNLDYYLDFLNDNRFNSVRIPFSFEFAMNLDNQVPYPTTMAADPALQGMTIRELMNSLIQRCSGRGISVLLDFHVINSVISEYPWTLDVGEEDLIMAWDNMMTITNHTNVIGLDIKNEPHDISWDVWGSFVSRFISHIHLKYPSYQGLFFVEGLNNGGSPWAASFEDMEDDDIKDKQRVVWSPHAYGPSVRGKQASNEGDEKFYQWFGFLKDRFANAIVLGEFGGYMTNSDSDLDWHTRLRTFLQTHNMTSSFYWTLFPDSRDTGGLFLADCVSVNYDKLRYLNALNTAPTTAVFS